MTDIETSPLGLEELIETLTGYDENEIEKRFGLDPNTLLEARPIMGGRAMAFIAIARALKGQDVKDAEGKAYKRVMGMTIRQVDDFFPDEPAEVDPEQPVTEAGKDEPLES